MNIITEKFNEVLKQIEEVKVAREKIEQLKAELRQNEKIYDNGIPFIFNTLKALETLIAPNEDFDPFQKNDYREYSNQAYDEYVEEVVAKLSKHILKEELSDNLKVNDIKEKKTKI